MKRDTGYILVLLLVIIAVVSVNRYQQYIVQKNFLLEVNTVCSAGEQGNCFVADCSPDDDPSCDTTSYKKVEILARDAPKCLEEHACEAFSCDGIENCSVVYCDDDSVEDGEICAIDDTNNIE